MTLLEWTSLGLATKNTSFNPLSLLRNRAGQPFPVLHPHHHIQTCGGEGKHVN